MFRISIYLSNLTILHLVLLNLGNNHSSKINSLLPTHQLLLPWFIFKMVSVTRIFFQMIIVVIAFAMMSLCLTDLKVWGQAMNVADVALVFLVLPTNFCLILYAYVNGCCKEVLIFWCVTHVTPTVISGILLALNIPPLLVVPSRTLGTLFIAAFNMEPRLAAFASVIAMSVIIITVLLSASFIFCLSKQEPSLPIHQDRRIPDAKQFERVSNYLSYRHF